MRWITESATWITELLVKRDMNNDLNILMDSIQYGVPEDGMDLARLNVFRRDHILLLIKKGLLDPLSVLDTDSQEIADTIFNGKPEKADELKKKITEALGCMLPLYRDQILKANKSFVRLIHQIYSSRGLELERPVQKLFEIFAPELKVKRITPQKAGEADFAFRARDGRTGIIQLASRNDMSKNVSLTKAGQVLQQSPELHPEIFVCIGFPGFDKSAILKGDAHGENFNYKAITLTNMLDLMIDIASGRCTKETLIESLENFRGIYTYNGT